MNDDGLGNTTSKSKEIQPEIMHKRKRKRMKVEDDRLSSLPDDLIHKIYSFIDIKRVVQTSVLSSRWRFVWASTPYLSFSSGEFATLRKFSTMLKHVLSGRNNEIDVYSVKLRFLGKVSHAFLKIILHYAFSHNVQEITVNCNETKIEFDLSLFNSATLKHLTLGGSDYPDSLKATSTVELPYLTRLHLNQLRLFDDNSDSYFAKCVNLKSLTLNHCKMLGSDGFTICHPQLLSLTLKSTKGVVKVIAPQLKNISLVLSKYEFPCFSNDLPSLEKVNICIHSPRDAPKIINMLQHFYSVKYHTINVEILEFLSSKVDLISNQPSPFANLETVKIYPLTDILVGKTQKKVDVSAVVKSYLLHTSPSSTFTMVSREEVRAVKNATLAQECFPKVRVLLDELKTDLDKGKTIMKNHEEYMHMHDYDKGKAKVNLLCMKQIHSCWEDLSHRISCEERKISRIFSELKNIEDLLTYVPESKKVKMQACFISMCEEADTVMRKILKRTKIVCDIKEFHLSVYFQKLSKALQPCS